MLISLYNFDFGIEINILFRLLFQQKPFVMKVLDSNGKDTGKFQGYCIDLIDEISKMINFEYEIYVAPDNSFGFMDDNGQWNGMIKELIEKVSMKLYKI